MLDRPANLLGPALVMRGFLGLRTGQGGLLTTVAELGAVVPRGDILCRISRGFGDVLEEITAPLDVLFVRATPMATVSQGERVATLGLL